jgi:uncharacterized membrane protein
MANSQATSDPGEPTPRELSDAERLILEVLEEQRGPLDGIAISSATRIPVEDVLRVLERLQEQGLVVRVEPEPVHQRFTPTGPLQHA